MWQDQKWQVCHALMLLPHSEVLQIKQPTIARPTQPMHAELPRRQNVTSRQAAVPFVHKT